MNQRVKIFEITEQANFLLAENLFTQMDSKKFVHWAVNVLEKGFETDNILILAGLDNSTKEEIQEYFWFCVKDLELELLPSDFELIENYAIHIAKLVSTFKIKPLEGLELMIRIVRESDYSSKYIQFYNLEEDIASLKYDNVSLYNSFVRTDDYNEKITNEFNLFLRAEELKLDDKYREYSYCYNCKTTSKPLLKQKRNWLRQIKFNYWACSNCKSKRLAHFSSQTGKHKILNEISERRKENAT